jgi:alkylation response protein AidB-like acyl-CoA dehydrogenase
VLATGAEFVAGAAPGRGGAAAAAPLAWCVPAALHAAEESIQMHGGIGFTWEHHVHRYLRRALAGRELAGSPGLQDEQLAAHLLARGGQAGIG